MVLSMTPSGSGDATDRLAMAIDALRIIYVGASATGRWYCSSKVKCVGHDVDRPDAGYYDARNPPDGYDAEGWIGTGDDDEESVGLLKPCEWEDFTLEEQSCWLETCADTAREALTTLGVPLLASGDQP
jgi:hypothetical protein